MAYVRRNSDRFIDDILDEYCTFIWQFYTQHGVVPGQIPPGCLSMLEHRCGLSYPAPPVPPEWYHAQDYPILKAEYDEIIKTHFQPMLDSFIKIGSQATKPYGKLFEITQLTKDYKMNFIKTIHKQKIYQHNLDDYLNGVGRGKWKNKKQQKLKSSKMITSERGIKYKFTEEGEHNPLYPKPLKSGEEMNYMYTTLDADWKVVSTFIQAPLREIRIPTEDGGVMIFKQRE